MCRSRSRSRCAPAAIVATLAGIFVLGVSLQSLAHGTNDHSTSVEMCPTASVVSDKNFTRLDAPYNERKGFDALATTPLWTGVLSHLLVNIDRDSPCFANSDTPVWGKVVSKIPADVVGIQTSDGLDHALIYVTGIPDYTMETPKLFASFKPGNIYGVFKIAADAVADTRPIHEFASKGSIGIFVNGVSLFNYTDTFSYNDKGVWSYDANVAEASIVNSDISHATPSGVPQFPKSRGIFHNHQMSIELLEQLNDAYVRGAREHSKLVGFAIDSYPIYGPLGYASKDASSGIKTLQTSYVKRRWLEARSGGTGHRSSIPEWAVRNWDRSNDAGESVLNLFRKPKAELLLADPGTDGVVRYEGGDTELADEIKALSAMHELKRDSQGYVYWEGEVRTPAGEAARVRSYLLKSSELWGPDLGAEILPVSYQIADKDKFLFKADTGAFAEDYEFIPGYGDLDFYNGIESYLPDQKRAAYHYVASFGADVAESMRLASASFPYFIGIQYRGVVDRFNATLDDKVKARFLAENREKYATIFDLGIIGKRDDGTLEHGSVIDTWRKTLMEE